MNNAETIEKEASTGTVERPCSPDSPLVLSNAELVARLRTLHQAYSEAYLRMMKNKELALLHEAICRLEAIQ